MPANRNTPTTGSVPKATGIVKRVVDAGVVLIEGCARPHTRISREGYKNGTVRTTIAYELSPEQQNEEVSKSLFVRSIGNPNWSRCGPG